MTKPFYQILAKEAHTWSRLATFRANLHWLPNRDKQVAEARQLAKDILEQARRAKKSHAMRMAS